MQDGEPHKGPPERNLSVSSRAEKTADRIDDRIGLLQVNRMPCTRDYLHLCVRNSTFEDAADFDVFRVELTGENKSWRLDFAESPGHIGIGS